ncbi:MAG: hypothetical protein IKM13_09990 [Clostridia bacterium]|nr:hypothetical protein [Clostridia bacterium]
MAYLVLSNGMAFPGRRFGADITSSGALAYTTGVVGYAETLLNPDYAAKIIVQSFPLIGNVGIDAERSALPISVAGYVVRGLCDEPNHFLCTKTLDAWLKEQGIPGISGIDTRHLVHLLKADPTLTATITDTLPNPNSNMGGNPNA